MLTRVELEFLRAAQAENLPERATIRRRTTTGTSDVGGKVDDLTTTATDVPCRIGAARTPVEVKIAERLGAAGGYLLTFAYGVEVSEKDVIEVGGRRFEVVGRLAGSVRTAERAVCIEAG